MKRSLPFLTLTAGLAATTFAHAGGPVGYDAYRDAAPVQATHSAVTEAKRVGGSVASFDEKRGVPTFMWAVDKQATSSMVGTAEGAARYHLGRYAKAYGLSSGALATAVAKVVHDTGRGGIIVSFAQYPQGIEVYQRAVKVLLNRQLELVAMGGSLHPAATPTGRPGTRDFNLPPDKALATALSDLLGVGVTQGDLVEAPVADQGPYSRFEALPSSAIAAAGWVLIDPARTKPIFYVMPASIVPAYVIEIAASRKTTTEGEFYRYIYAADDGRLLQRENLKKYDPVNYRVYSEETGNKAPLDGPVENFTPHPAGMPDGSEPAIVPSVVVAAGGFNQHGDQWLPHPAGDYFGSGTTGNNVDAFVDHNAPEGFTNGDFRGWMTAQDEFDWPYDHNVDPLASYTQGMAAVTQLFYNHNWLHDYWYDSGFDEVAGNAQFFNYGRGGMQGDQIQAQAQDWDGMNNAWMATFDDGMSPVTTMYMWAGPSTRLLEANPGNLSLDSSGAAFGPQNFDVTADLILVDDGTSPIEDGCDAPGGWVTDVSGKIALIDRGACAFVTKVEGAEANGALGVLIANHTPNDGTFTMGGSSNTATPSMMVSYEDGATLKTALGNGTVTVHMFQQGSPNKSGSFANGIVAHEWGHYQHLRLASGQAIYDDVTYYGQFAGQMEGYADFTAMHMIVREGDNLDGTFAGDTFAVSDPDHAYFGVRRIPYSVDMTKNALTFKHIVVGEPAPTAGYVDWWDTNNSQGHRSGEIWATMLFEGMIALLKQSELTNPPYSFDEAKRRMADYVVAGMKLQPYDPNYIVSRDAHLAVALAADPADAQLLAQGFATRGNGSCAFAPPNSSFTNEGLVESFELKPKLGLAGVVLTDEGGSCDGDGYLDRNETGKLRVAVINSGFAPMADGQLTVETATAGVTFPDGATMALPPMDALGVYSAEISVAVDDSLDQIELMDLTVTVASATSCETEVITEDAGRINLDDIPNSSTIDTVESAFEAWTKAGADATEVWQRSRLEPGSWAWQGTDMGFFTDTALESPDLLVGPGNDLVVSWDHAHEFEWSFDGTMTYWDAGVVEITEDDGATWTDISTYVDPGYNGTVTNLGTNTLADQLAYVSQNPSWPEMDTVTVNLGTGFANKTVRIRFRIATDDYVGAPGWTIDNIAIQGINNLPFPALWAHTGSCQQPPMADAGVDQTVDSGATVTLDASASSDADGDDLSFVWSQAGGTPSVTMVQSADGEAMFAAPEVEEDTVLTFSVMVHDGLAADTDEVDVLVEAMSGGTGGSGGSSSSSGTGGTCDPGAGPCPLLTPAGGGCGCVTVGQTPRNDAWWLLLGLGLMFTRRVRRGRA